MQNHLSYRKQIDFCARIYTTLVLMLNAYLWYRIFYCSDYFLYWTIGYSSLGIFLVEWAWYNTQRIHKYDEERDACFPAFRRTDAKHWHKWSYYPQAATTLIAKLWLLILVVPGSACWHRLILFGVK